MKICISAMVLTVVLGASVPCYSEDFSVALARARDSGQFAEALRISNEWISAEPKNPNAWLAQGYVLDRMRADEQAIQSYKRSIALKPDSFIAWHSLGSAHLNLKQYKAATVAFQEAVRLKPDDATARDNLEVARYCIDHCKEK